MAVGVYMWPDMVMFMRIQSAIHYGAYDLPHDVFDIAQQSMETVRQRAFIRASILSSRLARGLSVKVIPTEKGLVEIEVGSSFEGYPTDASDMTGNSAEAAQRGWATLAHRFHFGYPMRGEYGFDRVRMSRPFNPASGRTTATPFFVQPFEQEYKNFFNRLRDEVITKVTQP